MEENENKEVAENSTGESKNSMGLMIGGLVILGVVLVGGYFLMSGNKKSAGMVDNKTSNSPTIVLNDETTSEMPAEGSQTDETQEVMADEAGVVAVEGGSFYFKPNLIKAKVGVPVTIKFTSVGGMPHDFVVDEFNVKTEQIANDNLEFEFTPTSAGTFEFYCSVGNHRKMGMKGSLVVEE